MVVMCSQFETSIYIIIHFNSNVPTGSTFYMNPNYGVATNENNLIVRLASRCRVIGIGCLRVRALNKQIST